MKITEIRTYLMNAPGRNWVFVKVLTDTELYGWGEATLEGKEHSAAAAVHDLERLIVGEDPTRVEHLWQRMYRHGFWRGGVVLNTALSAIEQALWDITGKAYGLPVYRLFGGPTRDRVRCYTHLGRAAGESAGDAARRYVAAGWNALKMGPGRLHSGSEGEVLRRAAELVGEVREAVGPDVEIAIDNHGQLRPAMAIRLMRVLEPFRLLFFEEPCPPDNLDALRRIREAQTGMAMDLATGERAFTRFGFKQLLEEQLVDVIQPDLCHAGGIAETRKIAAMAETYYVAVAPHNPNGPVSTAAAVHLAASIPNFSILEYASSVPHRDEVQRGEPMRAEGGWIVLPEAPGLGVDLDEEYIQAHPYRAFDYPGAYHDDGSVADI